MCVVLFKKNLKNFMEESISSELSEAIKRDLITLIAFADRMRELQGEKTTTTNDLLKAILATHGVMKWGLSDHQIVQDSDKIVADFIRHFIASIEGHISTLKERYCASVLVKTNHPD